MAAPAPLVAMFFSVFALFAGGRASVITAGSSAGFTTSAIGSLFTGSGSGSVTIFATGCVSSGFTTTGATSATIGAADAGRLMITLLASADASSVAAWA